MTINDKYLLEEVKSGNKKAFEQIFKIYYEDLCRYALFLSSGVADTEDIVQDIFFKMWINRKDFILTSSLKSYLFTAVKNSVINIIKHEGIKEKYIQYQKNYEDSSENPDKIENSELGNKINTIISELPERRREIFIMSKLEGLKYKEIAEKLNISVKTVENQMGEALKFLREKLSGEKLIFILLLSLFYLENKFLIGVLLNLIVMS
ncbi:MAG: RNA polymerase sigma-70 factor [Bacteroidales bacterium]|nr:RNA polymerase sigma-70 factor [Bacteroidales bacterium]